METLERTTLEDRIKQALTNGTVLIDQFELDGIKYCLRGLVSKKEDGTYWVLWVKFVDVSKSHCGQQAMVGSRDEQDFGDHHSCDFCHPASEQDFWDKVYRHRCSQMVKFKVNEWNPDLTF